MIDRGTGIPVVLIPGIQGRWEWMASTVSALAERCRVLTFSLADEPSSGFRFDAAAGLDAYVQQIGDALARARVQKAVIVGVSYSGLVASEFAARHPDKVLGLVLASALPPGWTPDARARLYMRAPRLLTPVFWVTSPARLLPELRAALSWRPRLRFIASCVYCGIRFAISPVRMARRAGWTDTFRCSDPAGIHAPVLVVTGEDRLDRVVSPARTREYLRHLPHARHATLRETGHLGLVTKPAEFAELVARFAEEVTTDARRISA